MPSPTMLFFSRPRHSTAVERRPVEYLLAFGFFRLPRGVPRSCYQTHTNLRCRWPVWNQTPFARTRKRVEGENKKKTICYNVGLAVRIFPATMRTFTKDTAHSEQGRGAAWHVWGMAGERHGSNMGAVCYVWIGLNTSIVIVKLYLYSFIKGNKIFRNIGEHFPKNQSLIYQKTEYSTTFYTYLTKKMDQTECSETSAHKIQTPGNYPDESAQLSAKTLY
jgi:hypothetical protein